MPFKLKKNNLKKLISLVVLLFGVLYSSGVVPRNMVTDMIAKQTQSLPKTTNSSYGKIDKTKHTEVKRKPISTDIESSISTDIQSLIDSGEAYVELGSSGFSAADWSSYNNIIDSGRVNPSLHYQLSPLDELGRPVEAYALLTPDVYRGSKNRPSITVNPPGWKNRQLNNGQSLLNRSHLLAFAFIKADVDVKENLVSGLEDFNQSKDFGMQRAEKEVEVAVKSGHNVLYHVKTVYLGNELLPRGVLMRYQTEDGSLDKTVFVGNVMNGVTIDYQTGQLLADNT